MAAATRDADADAEQRAQAAAEAFAAMPCGTPRRARPASRRRPAELNNLSAAGAWRLARQIREFWAAAGFAVRVEVVHSSGTDAPVHYGVRTDMIRGLPRNNGGGRDGPRVKTSKSNSAHR
jgi:hypothetical protein